MTHNWLKNDVCAGCGTRRDGYGGGRTGALRYTQPDGTVTERAPECQSMGAPCPHASHNCLQCVAALKSEVDYLKRIARAYQETAEERGAALSRQPGQIAKWLRTDWAEPAIADAIEKEAWRCPSSDG